MRPEERTEMTKGETSPGEGSHLISKGGEQAAAGSTTPPTTAS